MDRCHAPVGDRWAAPCCRGDDMLSQLGTYSACSAKHSRHAASSQTPIVTDMVLASVGIVRMDRARRRGSAGRDTGRGGGSAPLSLRPTAGRPAGVVDGRAQPHPAIGGRGFPGLPDHCTGHWIPANGRSSAPWAALCQALQCTRRGLRTLPRGFGVRACGRRRRIRSSRQRSRQQVVARAADSEGSQLQIC
eukprot:COSAG01_NODE_367_length_18064_cov_23.990315_1_plen_192_part_00